MQLKYKLGSAIASAALFASVLAPAASAATITVSGNGAGSVNGVTLSSTKTKVLTQSNTTFATNVVSSNANSGNNTSQFNTGGASTVVSGPATSGVSLGVGGGSNTALLAGCGCAALGSTVTLSGNGAGSVNGVSLTKTQTDVLTQTSATIATNIVGSNANAGGNASQFNTGAGSTVATGPATSTVETVVAGGNNSVTSTP